MTVQRRRLVTGIELGTAVALAGTGFAGTLSRTWPPQTVDGVQPTGPMGRVIGVIITLGTKTGAGTLDSLRCVLASYKHLGTATTGATVPPTALIYDETFTSPAHSATVALSIDMFGGAGGDPQPFTDGIQLFLDVVCTGAVACAITVSVLVEEDV